MRTNLSLSKSSHLVYSSINVNSLCSICCLLRSKVSQSMRALIKVTSPAGARVLVIPKPLRQHATTICFSALFIHFSFLILLARICFLISCSQCCHRFNPSAWFACMPERWLNIFAKFLQARLFPISVCLRFPSLSLSLSLCHTLHVCVLTFS